MIINLQNVRNLRKRLAQERLVKVAGVIVKVRVAHVLLVARRPRRVLAVLAPLHGQPLLEDGHLPPQPVGVDLVAQPQLDVEAAALDVLLQYVLPHEAHAAQLGPVVLRGRGREVVAAVGDHAPARLVPPGHDELVPRAAQVRRHGVGPPLGAARPHGQRHVVLVEGPPLVGEDGVRRELLRVGAQVHA
jgi:hypothetical protein